MDKRQRDEMQDSPTALGIGVAILMGLVIWGAYQFITSASLTRRMGVGQ